MKDIFDSVPCNAETFIEFFLLSFCIFDKEPEGILFKPCHELLVPVFRQLREYRLNQKAFIEEPGFERFRSLPSGFVVVQGEDDSFYIVVFEYLQMFGSKAIGTVERLDVLNPDLNERKRIDDRLDENYLIVHPRCFSIPDSAMRAG